MKLTIINNSVVVVAKEHNPSILHPAFLESAGIVGKEWELAEPSVSTPPFSMVKYKNGIVFVVESEKLLITENSPPKDLATSEAPELAKKYLSKLPHVHYSAVGMNFSCFAECEDPNRILIDRFMKEGSWNDKNHDLQTVGLRFTYRLDQGVLNISCDSGKIRSSSSKEEKEGIIAKANYHRDLAGEDLLKEAIVALADYPRLCEHLYETMNAVLSLEI